VKIILDAPNHLNNHDITCTYNDVFNVVQRENKAYTVFYVSNYCGEFLDQVTADGESPVQATSDWHVIIDFVKRISQNNTPRPPLKIVQGLPLLILHAIIKCSSSLPSPILWMI
jgi:hypothetical protein